MKHVTINELRPVDYRDAAIDFCRHQLRPPGAHLLLIYFLQRTISISFLQLSATQRIVDELTLMPSEPMRISYVIVTMIYELVLFFACISCLCLLLNTISTNSK
jgi:hypothetical protein